MTYIPTKSSIPTGLDNIGLHLGLVRIEGEDLYNYQRRLILEKTERSGPTQDEFIRSLNRRVGELDIPCFIIDLVRDADNIPLAIDPYVEITSTYLRAYSDYDNRIVDVEVNLVDRDDGYFVTQVIAELSGSTYFSTTILDDNYQYRLSQNLRYGNTYKHIVSELIRPSIENKLEHPLVKNIYPRSKQTFLREVSSIEDIIQSGDYYVDYTNGVVYSYDLQSSFVSYTYRDFPFVAYWQPVKVYPYLDEDKKYALYDTLISDSTGQIEYVNLNPLGAEIANQVLSLHPLTWGS